jgi:hypothetical protein
VTRARRPVVSLSPAQVSRIDAAAARLPEDRRHGFLLRLETKLAMRGTESVSARALDADILGALAQLEGER